MLIPNEIERHQTSQLAKVLREEYYLEIEVGSVHGKLTPTYRVETQIFQADGIRYYHHRMGINIRFESIWGGIILCWYVGVWVIEFGLFWMVYSVMIRVLGQGMMVVIF